MSTHRSWKLKLEDGIVEHFIDVRRKVGNRVLRAYLLNAIVASNKIDTMKGSLRGPKDEFQDFAKFIVVKATENGQEFRFLVEAGVYENLRIVGTDSEVIAEIQPDEMEKKFTDVLQDPDQWESSIVVSIDSKVKV
ncbi:MAG: hypothetical protein KAQ65_01080 [Candidatus Thorarchaeota archaeon]|nr:hypothetical protein [Candidatus Thorarchaeota archaeon]MCK5237989.1 hypothetical protein [Candidatus Thorarchaeota archaeon]